MQTAWNPIFGYHLSKVENSQQLYDEIFTISLQHLLTKCGLSAIPVDGKVLTDAIFDLNSHDVIPISPTKTINGQQLKELFITTLFLRLLESKLDAGSYIFLALSRVVSSIDTAILVADREIPLIEIDEKTARLPKLHTSFEFQVKEFVDYQKNVEEKILTPDPINIEKLTKIAGNYKEIVLIYLRTFALMQSDDVEDFFKKQPKCYIILPFSGKLEYFPTGSVGDDPKILQSKPDKHNYIITMPNDVFSTITFNPPSCLVNEKDIPLPRDMR